MHKELNIYKIILKDHVSKCFLNKKNINPIDLNKERFKVRALFIITITYLIYNKPEKPIIRHVDKWLKNKFDNNNLFSYIIKNTQIELINLINKHLADFSVSKDLEIPVLYENLLGIEVSGETHLTEISDAKNYRNKLGSYYTPTSLAKKVTEATIDEFFSLNFKIKKLSDVKHENFDRLNILITELKAVNFVDFSCGAGNFIIAVLDYFVNIFHKLNINSTLRSRLLECICLNISAFDVDCIALELAKINLLLRIGKANLYNRLEKNFIHSNFLLHSDKSLKNSDKIDLFSMGYIYHEGLALDTTFKKEYDIILGNPPWEKIRFEEKKFYALYSSIVASGHFKSQRLKLINSAVVSNSDLATFSRNFQEQIFHAKKSLKSSSFFSLSNKGELNTYALFTEAAIKLKSSRGVVGLILKSGIVTSQVNKCLFKYITKEKLIIAIYDFINRNKIFNIDSRERFCFLLLGKSGDSFDLTMNLVNIDDIGGTHQKIRISNKILSQLNPTSGMLPNISNKVEADFLIRVSTNYPFFNTEFKDVRFGRIVHLTNHSEFISRKKSDKNIPIYEGKFFNQFDGKFSGFNDVPSKLRYGNKSSSVILDQVKKQERNYYPESRFFIDSEQWTKLSKNYDSSFMLAWRSLTSATNTRTTIATILPFIPASQSVQFLTSKLDDLPFLLGLFNSIVFDYIVKKKLSGIDLTQSVINQIPVPNKKSLEKNIIFNKINASIKEHITVLVLSLLKNDERVAPLLKEFGLQSRLLEQKNKKDLVRKIDLLIIELYQLNNIELKLVLSSFGKLYTAEDLIWFNTELQKLKSYNTIGSSITASATFSPV